MGMEILIAPSSVYGQILASLTFNLEIYRTLVADIVCVRSKDSVTQVVFVQCKMSNTQKGRDALIKFAATCGTIPVWASSVKHKIQLLDLYTNQELIP